MPNNEIGELTTSQVWSEKISKEFYEQILSIFYLISLLEAAMGFEKKMMIERMMACAFLLQWNTKWNGEWNIEMKSNHWHRTEICVRNFDSKKRRENLLSGKIMFCLRESERLRVLTWKKPFRDRQLRGDVEKEKERKKERKKEKDDKFDEMWIENSTTLQIK